MPATLGRRSAQNGPMTTKTTKARSETYADLVHQLHAAVALLVSGASRSASLAAIVKLGTTAATITADDARRVRSERAKHAAAVRAAKVMAA